MSWHTVLYYCIFLCPCLGTILQPTTPSAKRTKWLYGQCPLKLWWWEKSVLLVPGSCTWLAPDLRIFMLHDRVIGYWGNQDHASKKSLHPRPLKWKNCVPNLEVLLFLCETATDLKLWPKVLMVFNSSKLKPSTSGFAAEVVEAAALTVGAEVPVEVAPPC